MPKGTSPKTSGKKAASPKGGAAKKAAPAAAAPAAAPRAAPRAAAPVKRSKPTKGQPHFPRNPQVAPDITKFSRSAMYSKRGTYAINNKKTTAKKVVAEKAPKKAARFYPADDVPKKLKRNTNQNAPKVRASIQPGSILILLAGRFKGKRVVCVKALKSGLLVVTGPFSVNGVPLKRVNQRYVIATKGSVDVSAVAADKFDDNYFSKPADKKAKKTEAEFFKGEDAKKSQGVSADRKADQKAVDGAILKAASKEVQGYLAATFTLSKGQFPHEMVF